MADKYSRLVIEDLTGGMNGTDAPTRLDPREVVDAVNVDCWQTRFARKRKGCVAIGLTDQFAAAVFTGNLASLLRDVPGTDESAARLWGMDTAATPVVAFQVGTLAAWSAPTLKDAPTGNGWDFHGVSGGGLFVLAYKSAQNRLHLYDNRIAAPAVRRAGINPGTNAPTAANGGGAGAYPATLCYFRARYLIQVGGVTVLRSEATPSVSFTPSGANANVTITQPAAPNESETHWELEASTDNITFYTLGSATIATNPGSTAVFPANFATTGTASPATGTYTLPKPYKYICGGDGRILGFGSYNASDNQHTIEWSAAAGSLNVGDLERVDTTLPYKYVFDEHDTGVPTGIVGPVGGYYYAFKSRAFVELRPTGDPNKPFNFTVFKGIGAVGPKTISIGEDALGHPCLYFVSHRGPYRYGVGGLVYIGHGVEHLYRGPTTFLNLEASKVIAHAVYHSEKAQWWVWHATTTATKGSSDTQPTLLNVYTVRTTQGHAGGWARYTGPLATAYCSCLFADKLNTTSVSRDLKPYLGSSATTNYVLRCDDTSGVSANTDDGTTYQAYVDLKPIEPGGPGFYGKVGDAILLAPVSTGVTITATVFPDFDTTPTQSGTALLTADATETRVSRRLEGTQYGDLRFVSYRIGDAAAIANAWTLDRLIVPYIKHDAESA